MKTILLWVVFQPVFSIRLINNSPNSSRKMKGWSNLMTYPFSLNGQQHLSVCVSVSVCVCAPIEGNYFVYQGWFSAPTKPLTYPQCVPSFQSLPCQTSVHHFLDMDISRCVPSAFSCEPIVSAWVKIPHPDPIHTWDLCPPSSIFLECFSSSHVIIIRTARCGRCQNMWWKRVLFPPVNFPTEQLERRH